MSTPNINMSNIPNTDGIIRSICSSIEATHKSNTILGDNIISRYDLSGYINEGNPEYYSADNKRFMRVRYQKEHEGEYAIYQMKGKTMHGPAQLFEYNMLKMAWEMEDGKRTGILTLYEYGRVHKYTHWEYIHENEIRWVVNGENGLYLEIEDVKNKTVIYRGEYNPTTFYREGYGVEYDNQTGKSLSAGYYPNDKLVHIHLETVKKYMTFTNSDNSSLVMVEYGGEKDENNIKDMYKRMPVHCGHYKYNAKTMRFIRCGVGYEVDKESGMSNLMAEWSEEGELIEGSKRSLCEGWFTQGNHSHQQSSLRNVCKGDRIVEKGDGKSEIHHPPLHYDGEVDEDNLPSGNGIVKRKDEKNRSQVLMDGQFVEGFFFTGMVCVGKDHPVWYRLENRLENGIPWKTYPIESIHICGNVNLYYNYSENGNEDDCDLMYFGKCENGKKHGKGLLIGRERDYLIGYRRKDDRSIQEIMDEVESNGLDKLDKDENAIACWNEDNLVGRVPIVINTLNYCYEVDFENGQPIYLHNYILSNGWIVK